MKATIGIEVHVELKNMAKAFSFGKNSFIDDANMNVNLIDYGYPGVLPMLNKGVIDYALKACLAFNCKINKVMHFDRKNYFYADLPKGFQITQNGTPIGYDGYVDIGCKKIVLERIHIEEDTCKSVHSSHTLLNYNRAGVGLIEIVTTPCIENGEEAALYIESLRETLIYLGITDAKMEEGSMRCDVNVSVSSNDQLGVKCEVKNINSISNVKTAIDFEIARQISIIESGGTIVCETRRYNDKNKSTELMRVKEILNDYRYFIEPDLPVVKLSDEWIEKIRKSLPILGTELRDKYISLGLNNNYIKTIIANKELCDFFEEVIVSCNPVLAANFLTGEVMSYLNKNIISIRDTYLSVNKLIDFVNAVDSKKLSMKQAKDVINKVITTDNSVDLIISKCDITIISEEELLSIITDVINNNPESVIDYKAGRDRAVKFLMGQIMKISRGKADPVKACEKLIEVLDKK